MRQRPLENRTYQKQQMQRVTVRLTLNKLQPEDWQLFRAVHKDRDAMTWMSALPDEADIHQRLTEHLAP